MTAIVWTLLFLTSLSYFTYQIYGRFRVLLLLRKDDGRSYSSSTLATRIKNTLVYAFGQKKFFLDDQPAGVMHIVIFWGFLVLSLQVITMFLRGWWPEFYIPGLRAGWAAEAYEHMKDLFEVGVFVCVGIALFRWAISRPQRLYGILPAETKLSAKSHWEAYLILIFIMGILSSGLFYDAGRFLMEPGRFEFSPGETWSSIHAFVAIQFLNGWGNPGAIVEVSWWVHNLIILVFINLLPKSKHFHIITAIPNVFFGRVESRGRLPKKDFAADNALFGRSQLPHFTWKQALDMYSCTECGRCASVCPAAATGKPLAPRQFLLDLRDSLYDNQSNLLKLGTKASEGAAFDVVVGEGKPVIDEVIWSCVACRACEEACPVNIEYVDKIMDIRQHLTLEASRFPAELNRAFKGMETNSNPWGISSSERTAWAEGLDVPRIQDRPDVEYLYYVGCGGSFDAHSKKATQGFVKILKDAGVSFAILGQSETCNGDSARRLGNEYLFQSMAEALATTINESKARKILVNCPHCFNTLKNEYPEFGGNWQVIHAAQIVGELVAQGKVKLGKELNKKVVYHDSCYYGRYNDIYDEPRNLITEIPGVNLEEMFSCKRNGTCCGAGGGRMWMEEKADQRVNVMRTEQALEKKPDIIATSCPYCRIMIGNGVNDKGVSDKVTVMDVMELVAENRVPAHG